MIAEAAEKATPVTGRERERAGFVMKMAKEKEAAEK